MSVQTSLSRKSVAYLRGLVSNDPKLSDGATVVNIDIISNGIVLDLDDGTSIRVDIERYFRKA